MRTLDKVSIFLAELIGTGLLLFFGCGGCLTWGAAPSHLQMTLNFGLTVMFVIQIFGCVSGAHLNPAVTVAAFLYRLIDAQMAAVYVVAQLLGAFMGFGLLLVLTPSSQFPAGHCMTLPHAELTVVQAVGVEFVATAVLVLVCCGVWDPRNAGTHDSVGLRFGFTITALALVAGPYTGAGLNPARTFAPALWHGNMQSQWIYWVGPLAAAIVTPIVYRAVFRREVIVAKVGPEDAGSETEAVLNKRRHDANNEV